MTVSSMRLPAFSSAMMRWTSSQETYAPLTLTSCTRHTASRRGFTTPAVWRGDPARQGYTGLNVIIVRDDKIAALYVFLNSTPS